MWHVVTNPHIEFNYNNLYELDHDDLFAYVCDNILTYENIGKVLVMGDFNVRLGTYQNVEVNDNVRVSNLMHDSKDCTM